MLHNHVDVTNQFALITVSALKDFSADHGLNHWMSFWIVWLILGIYKAVMLQ